MIIINTQCAAVCGREPSRIRTTWKREHIIMYTNLNILYYYYTRLFTASDDENSCKHMRTHTNHSAWSRRSVQRTGWKQKTVLVEHEREGELYSFLTTIRPNRWLVEMLPVYYVMYKYRVHVYSVRENANETIGTQGMHIHCTHTHTHGTLVGVIYTLTWARFRIRRTERNRWKTTDSWAASSSSPACRLRAWSDAVAPIRTVSFWKHFHNGLAGQRSSSGHHASSPGLYTYTVFTCTRYDNITCTVCHRNGMIIIIILCNNMYNNRDIT